MSSFDFGLIINNREDDKIEREAKIIMSPQHFKALTKIMVDHVKHYEDLFGVINLEPNQNSVKQLQSEGKISGVTSHEKE